LWCRRAERQGIGAMLRAQPKTNNPSFGAAGSRQVMGEQFGLALDEIGKMLFQRRRDARVQFLAPAAQQAARARARAREAAGNQRPWPADKVERWGANTSPPSQASRSGAGRRRCVGAAGDDARVELVGSAGQCHFAAIMTPQIRDEGPRRVRPTVCRQFNRRTGPIGDMQTGR
jgi:hypothetical protein